MLKIGQLMFIVVLLNLHFSKVFSDEPTEDLSPSYEYIQIYQSMSALFEYLLNALEERPQMLETDDISMFKRHSDERRKRFVPYADFCDENEYKQNTEDNFDNRQSTTHNIDNRGIAELKQTECILEYGNNLVSNFDVDHCKIEEKREAARDSKQVLKSNKNERKNAQKREANKKRNTAWNSDDGYPGFQDLFKLDVRPKEIEEGFLLSEKLLEDFNSNRHK